MGSNWAFIQLPNTNGCTKPPSSKQPTSVCTGTEGSFIERTFLHFMLTCKPEVTLFNDFHMTWYFATVCPP